MCCQSHVTTNVPSSFSSAGSVYCSLEHRSELSALIRRLVKGGTTRCCPDKTIVKVQSSLQECSDRSGPELPHWVGKKSTVSLPDAIRFSTTLTARTNTFENVSYMSIMLDVGLLVSGKQLQNFLYQRFLFLYTRSVVYDLSVVFVLSWLRQTELKYTKQYVVFSLFVFVFFYWCPFRVKALLPVGIRWYKRFSYARCFPNWVDPVLISDRCISY